MFWLALGYPLLVHLAVVFDEPRLQWLALVWLLAISLWGPLLTRRAWAWVLLLASAIALYALVVMGGGLYALYVPPAVIPAVLFIVFARSLRTGEAPFISRFAIAMRGEPLPAPLVVYTRHVTQLWCGVFVVMFTSAVVTAIWASPELWSTMTNVVHYFALGMVFVLEFAYRRARFRDLEPWGLFEYLQRLIRTKIKR
jgi:uncharacterized membrane protein